MDMKISSTIGYERAHNPTLRDRRRGRVRRRRARQARAAAPELPRDRRAQPRAAADRRRSSSCRSLRARSSRNAPTARCSSTSAPTSSSTRRTSPVRSATRCMRAGFGSKLAWIGRPRARDRVHRPRRRRRPPRRAARRRDRHPHASPATSHGGMTSWRQERRPADGSSGSRSTSCRSGPPATPPLQILDVRERSEWDAGHIPGSTLTTWHDITEVPERLDPDEPIAVICASGQRAATAASLLQRHGASKSSTSSTAACQKSAASEFPSTASTPMPPADTHRRGQLGTPRNGHARPDGLIAR